MFIVSATQVPDPNPYPNSHCNCNLTLNFFVSLHVPFGCPWRAKTEVAYFTLQWPLALDAPCNGPSPNMTRAVAPRPACMRSLFTYVLFKYVLFTYDDTSALALNVYPYSPNLYRCCDACGLRSLLPLLL